MTYKLNFLPSALKEWKKLEPTIREQFKKKLIKRLESPQVEADRLRGFESHYKIKLKRFGYRLVYEVENHTLTVYVISVGKRENSAVYTKAMDRKKH